MNRSARGVRPSRPGLSRAQRLWLGLALLLAACAAQPPQSLPPLSGELPLTVQGPVQAGDSLEVQAGPVTSVDGTPATLVMTGSYGPRAYRSEFRGGVAHFSVPATDTVQSGVALLTVTAGNARGEAQVTLLPGPPAEPLIPLVGARSIVADGARWSMTVVVVQDELGNPVAEGTPVQVISAHPGQRRVEHGTEVEHLLAWVRVFSGRTAGTTTIAIRSGQARGPEARLLEVPGWPEPFEVSADPVSLPADGRQLLTLRTGVLADQFDNILPDGTLVSFSVEDPAGYWRIIPAMTVEGVAEAPLQAPREPGDLTVRALVLGVKSAPLTVNFTPGPAASDFPVDVHIDEEAGAVLVIAGPLLGPLEQFVPDGSPLVFQVVDEQATVRRIESVAEGGYGVAELRLAELLPGTYSVRVAAGSGGGVEEFRIP